MTNFWTPNMTPNITRTANKTEKNQFLPPSSAMTVPQMRISLATFVIICTTKPRGLCFTSLFPKLHCPCVCEARS